MDRFGTIDAYIKLEYYEQKLKTEVVTQKNGVVNWDEEFWLPVQLPIVAPRLVLKVYDHDKLSDDICGSMILDLKKIVDNLNGKVQWKNLFGAPLDCSGEHTNLMNENPEVASLWKGRILMQVTSDITDKPLMQKVQVDADAVKQA